MNIINLIYYSKFVKHCYDVHPDAEDWIECFHAEGFDSAAFLHEPVQASAIILSDEDYTHFILRWK